MLPPIIFLTHLRAYVQLKKSEQRHSPSLHQFGFICGLCMYIY